jgi:hypothetical protein
MGEAVKKPYTVSQELLRQWTEVRAPNETKSGRGIPLSRQTYANSQAAPPQADEEMHARCEALIGSEGGPDP